MPPRYDCAVTDFGEPARTSHISKMVLSIVKFGGAKLTGPLLDEDTLSDFPDDTPSVPG